MTNYDWTILANLSVFGVQMVIQSVFTKYHCCLCECCRRNQDNWNIGTRQRISLSLETKLYSLKNFVREMAQFRKEKEFQYVQNKLYSKPRIKFSLVFKSN